MNQRVKDLTPSDYEYGEVIKVVLPPSRNDYDRTPSGSRSFKRDMKTYVIRQNELNRLESKRALEHIDG